MRVALVHDYIKEYGGAERVLETLCEMFPDAPIYTAFRVAGSTADKVFRGKKIIESWLAPILKIDSFYSPLRFLTPLVWGSMNLSEYGLVISSSSWFITRGFKVGKKTKVVCYCHTPPRWLYGYETSVGFTRYWPVKIYSAVVGHFMRMYDFSAAQKVDYFIANSRNVAQRIKKFYRRDSTVIYPPVEVEKIAKVTSGLKKKNYFLLVSRLVGAKGIETVIALSKVLGFKLKIVGEAAGFSSVEELKSSAGENVEFLGRVSDGELYRLYGCAKGFITLAKDEDFGMTPVEAQAAGTPVIAFNGGGFKESIVDGVTGVLVNSTDEKTISAAIKRFEKIKWDKSKIQKNAKKFSKEIFVKDVGRLIEKIV